MPLPAEPSHRPRQQIISFLPKNKDNLKKKEIREKYTYRVPAFHGRCLEREYTHPEPVTAVPPWDRVTQPALSKREPFQMPIIYWRDCIHRFHCPTSMKIQRENFTCQYSYNKKPEKGCYRNAPQMLISSGRLELVPGL